jgi:hypothetical protein
MANVFGILTAIVLALAGFVAYKNKIAFETEIANTHTEKEKLKASEVRLDLAKTNLADTIAKRKGVEEENITLGEQEVAQTKANDDLKSQITTKTATIADNKVKLDDIRDKTSKVGDIKVLASKMKALKAEIEELTQNITSNEAKLANLNNENTQTEGQVKSLNEKFRIISENRSLPTLKTHIRSIYPTWGFVTLGSGNSAGVVTGSTLAVVRDGTTVAKLLVTAVERNSASASIVPDSLAQDTTLMIGDRVLPTEKAPVQSFQN